MELALWFVFHAGEKGLGARRCAGEKKRAVVRDFPEQKCPAPTPCLQNLSQKEMSSYSCRIFLERVGAPGGKMGGSSMKKNKARLWAEKLHPQYRAGDNVIIMGSGSVSVRRPQNGETGAISMLSESLGFHDPSN